jgi:hypothetical protein
MSVDYQSSPLPDQLEASLPTPAAAGGVSFTPEVDDFAASEDYRAVSASAVAGLALGILSPLALLDWWLGLIPLAAVALSFIGLDQTRKRATEYTGKALAVVGLILGFVSFAAGQAWLWNIYINELPEGYSRVSYAELQPQKGDSPNKIPEEALALNGKKVLIKGYVYPGNLKEGITQFLLVRDQGDCCFGGNPKVTDRINVRLTDRTGFNFHSGLFKVAGTFHITPSKAIDADGAVFYHLEGAQLR